MHKAAAQRVGTRRHVVVMLSLLALTLKAMVPSGFMPGTSLAAPIVLCPHQGAMPGMAMTGQHGPSKAPHGAPDHPCAFAGLGAAQLAAPLQPPPIVPSAIARMAAVVAADAVAPGRGLAAPPPPSHAPPAFRA